MGEKNTEKLIVNVNDIIVYSKMYHYMVNLLKKQEELESRKIIILCIGSDRYIGDALGPLVGSYLVEHTICTVYGNLDTPVHAGNLVNVIESIKEKHQRPIIIAVDACLGKNDEIGNIEIWEGSLEAGIAVGNKLPCIGTISIIGVVNASGYLGYLDLQSTPLSIVMKLSKCIGKVLGDAVNFIKIQ
ncbi:spore protease YyaC [Pelosinus propionicus]|uniref:Putative sporulation protein YyaC n=1 Tax=Pelosinus propionicus DSM 13327 TaxID=1123291 RepID=A0A1I4GUF3_9FIRM|nr:spore protease YyaC [Pelosinus propionicus]SFL32977.1 putative sporulation protein YyaC [Pelosinus propionicus DSM 13327]